MKRTLTLILFCALFLAACTARSQQPCKVVFYNVENFFDTFDDPDTQDDEFTPGGAKQWDAERYAQKLANIERVLADIAAVDSDFPAVIGLAEVENCGVVEDLVSAQRLAPAGYRFVHFDSPDERGIDVALLYRPDRFRLEGCAPVKARVPMMPHLRTRDILTVWGALDGEPFFFVVSHWPSRLGGQEASEFKRVAVGEQIRRIADSVAAAQPAVKLVIMGDFNDDPVDRSIAEGLGACLTEADVEPGSLFNPFAAVFRSGEGTLTYNNAWNLFDNIVVSANLVTPPAGSYGLRREAETNRSGHIFRPDYLLESDGPYRGTPLRSFVGKRYTGGFSDHLPVYICLEKQE